MSDPKSDPTMTDEQVAARALAEKNRAAKHAQKIADRITTMQAQHAAKWPDRTRGA